MAYDSTQSGVKKISFLFDSRSTETCHQIVRHLHLCAPHSLTAMTFASLAQQIISGERLLRPSSKTEMTRKLSIITGYGAGATESFVVEDYHQEYLFKNSSGYQCPTHMLHR
jgi:hypothetical protein